MNSINKSLLKYTNITISVLLLFMLLFIEGCGDADDPVVVPPDPKTPKVIMDPAMTNQEMVGFGGAITWYCDRVTNSSKKDEIIDLIVNDLEVDIVRLKNWYYPLDYPTNKTSDVMEVGWFKGHYDATNELFDLLKQADPNVKILLSSWGPPSALKSNGKLQEGTLKKVNNVFVYDEFATYWEDILNNITFNPDYLSMQNEPSYVNAGWETCEWAAAETSILPGYEIAFDKLYEKIKDRNNLPELIGPESANLSSNAFSKFADVLKDKTEIGMYAYHPYNFNESTTESEMRVALSNIKTNYSNKPNLMTEYSGMSWYKTAQLINSALTNANSSGYIYWELVWDENSEYAMINVTNTGTYELTPFYYLIKHYSKFISRGYKRVDLSIENSSAEAVAFINPTGNQIALVLLNPASFSIDINAEISGKTISHITGVQSTEDDTFKELTGLFVDKSINLKSKSVTTIILDI